MFRNDSAHLKIFTQDKENCKFRDLMIKDDIYGKPC